MKKYYYEDKTRKELKTIITDIYEDNSKCYIKLEDSIFYPQGGGQKGDKGYIILNDTRYDIVNTIKDENYDSILIINEILDKKFIGNEVTCFLDWDYRYKQMRLHTALHIYHMLLHKYNINLGYPIISNIEGDIAYNKYNENEIDISSIEKVNDSFYELINTDNKVITYKDSEKENYRWWECMNYKIPCGGIHVDKLSDIGNVKIETKHKKGIVTINILLD